MCASTGTLNWVPILLELLLVVGASTAVVGAHPIPTRKTDVIQLTDDNFDVLTKDGAWFVDIYAPWCSHCRQLEPTWEILATQLASDGVNVAKLKDFALGGYGSTPALPFHKAPNSILGRKLGLLYTLPAVVKKYYKHHLKDRGYSDSTILAGFLCLPVIIGILVILALEFVVFAQGGRR